MPRSLVVFAFAGLCAGCISIAPDRTVEIDFQGCQPKRKAAAEPALRDGAVVLATGGNGQRVVSALAWGTAGQDAVNLELSTAPIHCTDLEISEQTSKVRGSGVLASIRIAPVLVDDILDTAGSHWTVIPAPGTWRAVSVSAPEGAPHSGLWHVTRSVVASPTPAIAERGAHERLRVVVETSTPFALGGELDVEGCGRFPTSIAPRPQHELAVRIGARSVPILGATFRPSNGDRVFEMTLTSGPSDCDRVGRSDLVILVDATGATLMGEGLPTVYSRQKSGLSVMPEADAGASAKSRRFNIMGSYEGPTTSPSKPRSDLEARDYLRSTIVTGRVDALVCPPR